MLTKLFAAAIPAVFAVSVYADEISMKISKRYLNFPISHSVARSNMRMNVNGRSVCKFDIRLAPEGADYWTFCDVSKWRGKTVTLSYDGDAAALKRVVQADTIYGAAQMYREKYRPAYHFTSRRGWINDPNGLVYYKGKYHLFYQHNPYEREWGNMHWGHAVSTDLVHWQEWGDVLHPDTLGTMFSGSAVIDYDNTSGFGKKGKPAMVAFYTADGKWETQCMAYSLDEGRTFTKYAGNPVVDSHEKWNSHDTRDPKVFWYDKGKHWVMVVNECSGNSIYNSADLVHWQLKSHINGFWECPELFELPVDGDSAHTKWVMWGASGTYMIGSFDGERFVPETGKLQNLNGSVYACQTYNYIPRSDGRVIKMGWANIDFDGMPFRGCMLLPQEQTLHSTPVGIRLFTRPVKETEEIFERVYSGTGLTVPEANKAMRQFGTEDKLRLKFTISALKPIDVGLALQGQRLLSIDLNHNTVNGAFYAPADADCMKYDVDLYVDGEVVEAYIDDGAFSYSFKRNATSGNGNGYEFFDNLSHLDKLEVYRAKNIWN